MEGLIKMYLEKGDPETELEVRFGTKGEKNTKINYNNVIKKLKSLGFNLLNEKNENTNNSPFKSLKTSHFVEFKNISFSYDNKRKILIYKKDLHNL